MLLNAKGPETTTSSDRVQSSSVGRKSLLGAVVVGLLVVGGALLLRSPEDPAPPADESAAEAEDRTSLREAQSTRASTEPAPVVDEELLLGESFDWFVVVQTADGASRVDLNTGNAEDLGVDGVLLGEAWGRVLFRRLSGELQIIDADEFGGQLPITAAGETDIRPLGANILIFPGSRPGRAWLKNAGAGIAWQVDLADGAVLRMLELQQDWSLFSPDFATPNSGGIYALQEDDSYLRVSDGRLLAEGPDRLLIDRCNDVMECGSKWVSADTFKPLPQSFNSLRQSDGFFPQPSVGGRFLSTNGGLVDAETGAVYNLDNAEFEAIWEGRLSISSDAELIVMALSSGKLRVRQLGEPGGVVVDGFALRTRYGVAPVFVPRASVETDDG